MSGDGILDAIGDLGEDLVEGLSKLLEKLQGMTSDDDEDLHERTGFDYAIIPPLAMTDGLPLDVLPSLKWMKQVGRVAVEIHSNLNAVEKVDEKYRKHGVIRIAERLLGGEDLDLDDALEKVVDSVENVGKGAWFEDLLESIRTRPGLQATPPTIEHYEALFVDIELPASARVFLQDANFAERRLAGPNPTSLQRVHAALPATFPLTEAQFASVLPGQTLQQAIDDGLAYLLDFGGLQPTIPGTFPDEQKYVYEPIALFVVDQGELKPIAIQPGQDPSAVDIALPGDGDRWSIAKTIVDVADANYHELVAHLGRTHLVVEPFTVVTERRLAKSHPIRRLLEPHFEGTQFINWAAGKLLVAPRNAVDELLAGTIDADRTLSVRVTASRSFADSFLPKWLAAQGLDDTSKLPHYPFRDDALELWKAIHDWVTDYVAIHYPGNGDLISDPDLQVWARDLAAFDGGRVGGFGNGPQNTIVTTAYLANALTMVIFTASAMHAAVNFPQRTVMSFPPAMPLAGYAPAPAAGTDPSHQDWLATLPGLDQAMIQINVLTLLGGVYHTQLGQYPDDTFDTPDELAALAKFQSALGAIEQKITLANQSGLRQRYPYEHLLPSRIPQSINI